MHLGELIFASSVGHLSRDDDWQLDTSVHFRNEVRDRDVKHSHQHLNVKEHAPGTSLLEQTGEGVLNACSSFPCVLSCLESRPYKGTA